MIIVAGTVFIKPDARAEAVAAAAQMAAATQAEAGCLSYRFYRDVTDPNRFFVFEVWESEAALEVHFQTPHMAEFQQRLPELVDGPAEIQKYVVASVTPL